MHIELPESCLVMLIGVSGSGKSTFARKHFQPTEILSSDRFRAMVCDDEANQAASRDAFTLLRRAVKLRLKHLRMVVVDATNLQKEERARLHTLAKERDVPRVAILLDLPAETCQERNATRARKVPVKVLARQRELLERARRDVHQEGFQKVVTIANDSDADTLTLHRNPFPGRQDHVRVPLDIIGDVHGCWRELTELLKQMGYAPVDGQKPDPARPCAWAHPAARRLAFIGDLCNKGPQSLACLELAMACCEADLAWWLPGNHEDKLRRKLEGRNVKFKGNQDTAFVEIEALPKPDREQFARRYLALMARLPHHLLMHDGALCLAHAGIPEAYQGRSSERVRAFTLYGDPTGENDEEGYPLRNDWASEYKGARLVVYGHTPIKSPVWRYNTLCIDTGCVYGGRLTALRWPEREIVSVPAHKAYSPRKKPLADLEPEMLEDSEE